MSEWAEWVEILWGFTKFFFKQILKFSAFFREKQKKFIPKKKLLFRPLSLSRPRAFQQMALCCHNFQERFWICPHYLETRQFRQFYWTFYMFLMDHCVFDCILSKKKECTFCYYFCAFINERFFIAMPFSTLEFCV